MFTRVGPELSLLIPAHNEERRIGSCLTRLSAFLEANHPASEIIVTEDGSRDRTVGIVDDYRQRSRIPIILLHSPVRLGKGGGLKRGIRAANGHYAVFTDTDLPVPLESINLAVQLLKEGADLVAGSRIIKGSRRDEPVLRRFLSYSFHVLSRVLLGIPWDSQCGFKAMKTHVGRAAFNRIHNPGFAFDAEFLLQAKQIGARVVELPVQWHYSRDTSMRLSKDVVGMFKELVRIFVRARLHRSYEVSSSQTERSAESF